MNGRVTVFMVDYKDGAESRPATIGTEKEIWRPIVSRVTWLVLVADWVVLWTLAGRTVVVTDKSESEASWICLVSLLRLVVACRVLDWSRSVFPVRFAIFLAAEISFAIDFATPFLVVELLRDEEVACSSAPPSSFDWLVRLSAI